MFGPIRKNESKSESVVCPRLNPMKNVKWFPLLSLFNHFPFGPHTSEEWMNKRKKYMRSQQPPHTHITLLCSYQFFIIVICYLMGFQIPWTFILPMATSWPNLHIKPPNVSLSSLLFTNFEDNFQFLFYWLQKVCGRAAFYLVAFFNCY